MKADYYRVLGVDRAADAEQIRQAYRRMAKTHHPDLNASDPEADARFKAINEAYEVLRDPQKRAVYDRYGHRGLERGGSADVQVDFGDLGDILDAFFGMGGRPRERGRRQPAAERGGDLRTRLGLSFEEAVFGAPRQVDVLRRERCEACAGSGAAAGSAPVACPACQGSGEVRRAQQSIFGSFVSVGTCGQCAGRGELITQPCPTCAGQGRNQVRRSLEVDIPAGVADGVQIRLAGEGEQGRWGGPPGDLLVSLSVAPHPIFERHGEDLHLELRLNAADAALGAEIEVPTADGQPVRLKIPPGTQTGDVFELKDLGVPRLRQSGRGRLVVTAFVAIPEQLTRAQRDLLEQLRATLPGSGVAQRDQPGFWERLRDRFT